MTTKETQRSVHLVGYREKWCWVFFFIPFRLICIRKNVSKHLYENIIFYTRTHAYTVYRRKKNQRPTDSAHVIMLSRRKHRRNRVRVFAGFIYEMQ